MSALVDSEEKEEEEPEYKVERGIRERETKVDELYFNHVLYAWDSYCYQTKNIDSARPQSLFSI